MCRITTLWDRQGRAGSDFLGSGYHPIWPWPFAPYRQLTYSTISVLNSVRSIESEHPVHMKQNQNLIDMAAQVAGTITLHIQREMAPLRKRLDQLERRLAQLESAKTAARDDA